MLRIGDFSQLARISVRMLRYYDDQGLLCPEEVDPENGYRYYRGRQLVIAERILRYRDMGFSIAEIKTLLSSSSQVRRDLLQAGKEKRLAERQALERAIEGIDLALANTTEEEKTMMDTVRLEKIEAFPALSLRKVIPAYDREGDLWSEMGAYIERKGLDVGQRSFATYHDEGHQEGAVDVEILIEVPALLDEDPPFAYRMTEAIEKAACLHVHGPYDNIGPAFAALGQWIDEQGYQMAGLVRQVPLRGPWNTDDPEAYLVEIQIPLIR